MPIGPVVRRAFGPFEHWVTAAYRSIYVDLDDYVGAVRAWVPAAREILEVGCGEGAVTERLVSVYPDARITAIDITPRVGKDYLYRGPADRVRFRQCTVQEIAAQEAGRFDLAMIADVVHHVPTALRKDLLDSITDMPRPRRSADLQGIGNAAGPPFTGCAMHRTAG